MRGPFATSRGAATGRSPGRQPGEREIPNPFRKARRAGTMGTRMPAKFEVLPGLPSNGPLSEPFTATGQGTHREGYVVRFSPANGESWVGNFQRGSTRFETVVEHPNQHDLIVIAGGQGYVVDPSDRIKRNYMSSNIDAVFPIAELRMILLTNGLWVEALASDGLLWRSQRISWDGMRNYRLDGSTLLGEAWLPWEDRWIPFEVDVQTGSVRGGSYRDWDSG